MWCGSPSSSSRPSRRRTTTTSKTRTKTTTRNNNNNKNKKSMEEIMTRTSPPILQQFIDELSFWDQVPVVSSRRTSSSSSRSSKTSSSAAAAASRRNQRSQDQRFQLRTMKQAMAEDDGSDDDDDDEESVDECDGDESMTSWKEESQNMSSSAVSKSSSSSKDTTASSSLPSCPWKIAIDRTSKKPYYYHTKTRETTWDKPSELRTYERRLKQERRKQDRLFFTEMEQNLLRAVLERGELIPGVPYHQTPHEGPPQEPLPDRKPRVRTISGMDDVLLAELRDDDHHSRDSDKAVMMSHSHSLRSNVPVSSSASSATSSQTGATAVQTGRPPLPRPVTSTKTDNTVAVEKEEDEDDMVISPDIEQDEKQKHSFHQQQQAAQPEMSVQNSKQRTSTHSLAGENLLDAPIHNEWSDCIDAANLGDFGTTQSTSRDSMTTSSQQSSSNTTTTTIETKNTKRTNSQGQHTRRNTGGTIYLDNTMTNPDIQATMRCVCAIIRAHIIQNKEMASSSSSTAAAPRTGRPPQEYLVFKDDYGSQSPRSVKTPPVPTLEEVTSFYEAFYKRSQMEHDTIITSLIYLERLIKETNGALGPDPENWHSILFATMVLASKVWDDLSMWNVDFSNVSAHTHGLSSFTLGRINQLEIELLKILHFDVKVPASEYAKYYFLIRTMLLRSGLVREGEKPLQKREAFKKFESVTRSYETNNNNNNNGTVQCTKPKSIDRRVKSMDATFSPALVLPTHNFGIGPVLKDTVCLEQLTTC